MKNARQFSLFLLVVLPTATSLWAQPQWPPVTRQMRPWTRWWWMGSAVNDTDLTRLLQQYRTAGLGGVEITPIYGVKGEEANFINFLSPAWMGRLTHTLTEANRLDMGVDLAQASGWPFGGPWVSPADACKYVAYQTYTVIGGASVQLPIQYLQKPIVRTVGEPIALDKLIDPITKNPDLQRHAFDQVRFQKLLPLLSLMAFPAQGAVIDLTNQVDSVGQLTWAAPPGQWTLYAVFMGWHGKQVERAGPGGEGDVIDHFSKTATEHYLQRFDSTFVGHNLTTLRAFFNDSYEVDDAQGQANWTPHFFAEFQQRRGYDLRQYLPALFGKTDTETNQRILSDYRETISTLLLENYTETWGNWAKKYGKKIRNQAHGSPANILDLYAATDIPEAEGTDLLRIKFASSAAHVTGKQLASSESATWNNEHFVSRLSDIKIDMDRFLLAGINHTFYHGTNYSPQDAAWPGWLFYAAVHVNPNNTFWTDFGQLNRYVTRCQSFLQAGKPDNDILLYLPMYDAYARPGKELLQHFDGLEHGLAGLPIEKYATELLQKGYSFDYISDQQILNVKTVNGSLQTGSNTYRTIIVPDVQYMPLATLQHLIELARQGASIIFANKLPTDVNGFSELQTRQYKFNALLKTLHFNKLPDSKQRSSIGQLGSIWVGKNIAELLPLAGVFREEMIDRGLYYIRRRHATGRYYFIVNDSPKIINGWVPIQTYAESISLFNPMTGQTGKARYRMGKVWLQLASGESCILETFTKTNTTGPMYPYQSTAGTARPIRGKWTINFVSGGPSLPVSVQTDKLGSWTTWPGEAVKSFAGTADYTITFSRPTGSSTSFLLDLGRVAESARVRLNGVNLDTLIGAPFRVMLPYKLFKLSNTLTISVSNGMANQISDMDRRKIVWKKFYNINMPARLRENRDANGLFTAERWLPIESGLLGPVTLTPLRP